MNKTDSFVFDSSSRNINPKRSVGVGDVQLFLHRDTMQWSAVLIDGRFFMADPQSVSKLMQIQAEIEHERIIAEHEQFQQRMRSNSFHSYRHQIYQAEQSCLTEVDPQRQRLSILKMEEELQKQEQLYHKRIAQARNKKKQERKAAKNLVKFTQKQKEDFKSVKMEKQRQATEIEVVQIQHSMMNKITPTKQDLKNETDKKNKKGNESQKPSLINAKLLIDQTITQKQQKSHKQQPNKLMQLNSIIKIAIDQPVIQSKQNKAELLLESNTYHFKPKQQNQILLNIDNNESPSILGLKTQQQHKKTQQMTFQRAGDRFFYQPRSKIDKLQQKIQVTQNQSPSPRKMANLHVPETIKKYQKLQYKFVESNTMINTKKILKDLNKQLKQIGLIQPAQDSRMTDERQLNSFSGIKMAQIEQDNKDKNNYQILAALNIPEKVQKTNRDLQLKNQIWIKIQPSPSKPIKTEQKSVGNQMQHSKTIQIKRDNCKLISSLVNQQILQGTPKTQPQKNKQQKQKLNEEISILKQVINELRVQRIKYQTSNNDNAADGAGTVYSNFHKTERDANNDNHHMSHRVSASIFNNFSESAVSEFQNNQHRSLTNNKSSSGRIIKNFSPSRKMYQIEEQRKSETKQKQIKQRQIKQEQFNESQRRQTENYQNLNKQENKDSRLINIKDTKSIKIKTGSEEVSNKHQQSNISKNIQIAYVNNSQSAWGSNVKSKLLFNKSIAPTINNNSIKVQPDMESSMPRPLNKHNHSQPPKFLIHQHQNLQRRHQSTLKKKAVDNFDSMQNGKNSSKTPSLNRSAADPKKRANKQRVFKTVEAKASYHPDLNKIVFSNADTNLKNKIIEIEQNQKDRFQQQGMGDNRNSFQQSKSSKGFRLRRGSDSNRQSRVSSTKKQQKQYERLKSIDKEDKSKVFIPALHQQNFVQPSPVSKNQSIPIPKNTENQSTLVKNQKSKVQRRTITFTTIDIPKIPEPPTPSTKIEQMAQLIKKICTILNLQVRQSELHRLIMKKYKNCIMLDIPNSQTSKLVWHYNGKLYIGQWNETQMLKSGQGIQYIPEKYYYKGQFMNGKRNGSGVMIQQVGIIYQGQWQQGEKNGRGKYYDPTNKINYEGQWKNGKKEGFGYFCIDQQSIYQGTFLQNLKDGYGVQLFHNQDSYKGQYKKGRFYGKGRYIWASGDTYQGQFYEGCKHGRGIWTSFIGQAYEGGYKHDKKSGSGKYRWGNGCVFEGQFQGDKKNGNGILKYPNGREVKGIWRQGKLIQTINQERKDDMQQPLSPKKSKLVQTTTHIKVQSKPYNSSAVQQRKR